jgi:glycosyltransferase involved in cell wall biosynthesis
MKILWASRYCLLDGSSGASISVREILRRFSKSGHEVRIVGASIFDDERGRSALGIDWENLEASDKKILRFTDGQITHLVVKTRSWRSSEMKLDECNLLYSLYTSELDSFHPDIVFFYGGNSFDFLIPDEAKARGIKSAAYLVNGNYAGLRWNRDVDLIVTDTKATAKYYLEKFGYNVVPVGVFINPGRIICREKKPEVVTFINPSLAKGAAIVAQLAFSLEKSRPDIRFEVVENRGNWGQIVNSVSRAMYGQSRSSIDNVRVVPFSNDMREVYARSRALLVPSLWWESGARILAEAMMNGIPAIVTDYGGNAEMVGNSGFKFKFPEAMHKPPYTQLLSASALQKVSNIILKLHDDELTYSLHSARARQVAKSQFDSDANFRKLELLFGYLLIGSQKSAVKYIT